MKLYVLLFVCVTVAHASVGSDEARSVTAADIVKRIYHNCLKIGSFACVKPKVLGYLSHALKQDKILLTRDLSIVKNGKTSDGADEKMSSFDLPEDDIERREALRVLMLDKIDDFLNTHELKLRVPKEILNGDLLPYVPKFLIKNIPEEIVLPLQEDTNVEQGRGFVKKVLIPFLLGLKFKATALIPLAITMIALKTWKALTLGLISMVLSGALVIFRFTKPKVINYEVYHYPSHQPSPTVEHSYSDHHGYGRSVDELVYRGHVDKAKDSSR